MSIRNRVHGFTLIEIMIAVAIIAILAGIAMPAYSGYTIRSKVSECLVLSSGPKLEVSERRARGATSLAGSAGNFTGTRYCADMTVGEGGEIVMTTQATGAAVDPVLQLTPTGIGADGWSCGYLQGDPKYLPANCRNQAVAAVTAPAPGAPSSPPVIDPFPSNPNPPTTPPAPPAPSDPAPADPAPTPDPTGPAPTDPTDPVPPSNPPPAAPPPSDPAPSDPPPSDPPPSAPGPGPGGPGAGPTPEPIDDGRPGSRSWCESRKNPPAALCDWMDGNP